MADKHTAKTPYYIDLAGKLRPIKAYSVPAYGKFKFFVGPDGRLYKILNTTTPKEALNLVGNLSNELVIGQKKRAKVFRGRVRDFRERIIRMRRNEREQLLQEQQQLRMKELKEQEQKFLLQLEAQRQAANQTEKQADRKLQEQLAQDQKALQERQLALQERVAQEQAATNRNLLLAAANFVKNYQNYPEDQRRQMLNLFKEIAMLRGGFKKSIIDELRRQGFTRDQIEDLEDEIIESKEFAEAKARIEANPKNRIKIEEEESQPSEQKSQPKSRVGSVLESDWIPQFTDSEYAYMLERYQPSEHDSERSNDTLMNFDNEKLPEVPIMRGDELGLQGPQQEIKLEEIKRPEEIERPEEIKEPSPASSASTTLTKLVGKNQRIRDEPRPDNLEIKEQQIKFDKPPEMIEIKDASADDDEKPAQQAQQTQQTAEEQAEEEKKAPPRTVADLAPPEEQKADPINPVLAPIKAIEIPPNTKRLDHILDAVEGPMGYKFDVEPVGANSRVTLFMVGDRKKKFLGPSEPANLLYYESKKDIQRGDKELADKLNKEFETKFTPQQARQIINKVRKNASEADADGFMKPSLVFENNGKKITLFPMKAGTGQGRRKKGSGDPHINDRDWLFDDEIHQIMSRNYPEKFGGVADADNFDNLLRRLWNNGRDEFGIVINESPENSKGTHWLGLMVSPLKTGSASVEYYDSYGKPPKPEIKQKIIDFVNDLKLPYKLKFKVNNIAHQNGTSDNCGFFVMRFLSNRFHGDTFKEATNFDKYQKNQTEQAENSIKKDHAALKPKIAKLKPMETEKEEFEQI